MKSCCRTTPASRCGMGQVGPSATIPHSAHQRVPTSKTASTTPLQLLLPALLSFHHQQPDSTLLCGVHWQLCPSLSQLPFLGSIHLPFGEQISPGAPVRCRNNHSVTGPFLPHLGRRFSEDRARMKYRLTSHSRLGSPCVLSCPTGPNG